MPVIARTRAGDHELSGQGTLMVQCLGAGLPVASSCAGRGACAKCAMRILEGQTALFPPAPHEALVLLRERLPEDVRLSCQTCVRRRGDRVILQTGYW